MKPGVFSLLLLALSAQLFPSLAAIAAQEDREPPAELLKYELTGDVQNCINRIRIRRAQVLDDYTILFHMNDGRIFKNELPFRCFGLGFEKAFGYTLTISLLCDVDLITVISQTGMNTRCALGEFEEIEPTEES